MKTTGVIRKLDELGRITLPIELRRSLDLDVKDGLEITVQNVLTSSPEALTICWNMKAKKYHVSPLSHWLN